MRIVSNFSDYYDIGQSAGVDQSQVFIRKKALWKGVNWLNSDSEDATVASPEALQRFIQRAHQTSVSLQPLERAFLIGFCGWIHTCVRLPCIYEDSIGQLSCADSTSSLMKGPDSGRYKVIQPEYTHYEVDETYWAHKKLLNKAQGRDTKIKPYRNKCHWLYQSIGHEDWLAFKPFYDNEPFQRIGAPAFAISCHQKTRFIDENRESFATLINPCLKEFSFYQNQSSWEAYQNLSMYLSGVLTENANPSQAISDNHMRDAKGFDQWSFKKKPKKKR